MARIMDYIPLTDLEHHRYWAAYVAFKNGLGLPTNANSHRQFNNFLCGSDRLKLTDEAIAKLAWLNGPHCETLLKAWLIKHGE